MNNLKPFIKKSFFVEVKDGSMVSYDDHAAAVQDGHLFIGTLTWTNNGELFEVIRCIPAGTWTDVRKTTTEEA